MTEERLRVIVMTDISSFGDVLREPDDTESMVRFLLYANEWDIEGLTATAYADSGTHAEYLEQIVEAYGKVYENLLLHDKRYPEPETLKTLIKTGNENCRLNEPGAGQDTEASEWLISAADRDDPRPVWVLLWGGAADIAQAVWKVAETRSEDDAKRWREKLRVYAIGDQYGEAGPWIKRHYPDLFYITSYQSFRGMYRGGDASLASPEWVKMHISKGHGELGTVYPVYDGGDPWGAVKGLKEGDTPSFLYLIPNGLGRPECPQWGCWGGRFCRKECDGNTMHFSDAEDTWQGETSAGASVYRWREAYQADFQARMDWCVQDYAHANHPPVVLADAANEIWVSPGEEIVIDASASFDPDGGNVTFRWEIYKEAGYGSQTGILRNSEMPVVSFIAPQDESSFEIHLILAVSDDGTPPLTRYRRFVVKHKDSDRKML